MGLEKYIAFVFGHVCEAHDTSVLIRTFEDIAIKKNLNATAWSSYSERK